MKHFWKVFPPNIYIRLDFGFVLVKKLLLAELHETEYLGILGKRETPSYNGIGMAGKFLTLLNSEPIELCGVLAILSATGLIL